jgi:hypothetical protein
MRVEIREWGVRAESPQVGKVAMTAVNAETSVALRETRGVTPRGNRHE